MGQAGGGYEALDRERPCRRRADEHRGGLLGRRRDSLLRDVSGRQDHHRLGHQAQRPGRDVRRRRADPELTGRGPDPAPVQDGHAPPRQRPVHRLLPVGTAGGGRERRPLLLCQPEAGGKPGVLLHHLHQRENPRDHPGQSGPLPPLLRRHPGGGAAVLSLHRGQGRPLCGQAPAPAFLGADGLRHRRDLCPGLFLLFARGRAGGHAPHPAGVGAGGDDPPGLRH